MCTTLLPIWPRPLLSGHTHASTHYSVDIHMLLLMLFTFLNPSFDTSFNPVQFAFMYSHKFTAKYSQYKVNLNYVANTCQ